MTSRTLAALALLAAPGLAQQSLLTIPGPVSTSVGGFGQTLVALGDVDGDGHGDVLAGNSNEWGASFLEGIQKVISGASGDVMFTYRGATFEELGRGAGALPDLDADGIGDFWLSSQTGLDGRGAIYAYSGATGVPIRTFGALPGDRVNSAAASLGDLDGDGTPDLAIGLGVDGQVPAFAGAVSVRSGATGTELYRVVGSHTNEGYGRHLASIPDIDGDGFRELVVGSIGTSMNGGNSGAARILSGATGTLLRRFDGASEGAELGRIVADAGDVNGDGIPDILVTSRGTTLSANGPEEVFIYSTTTGAELHRFVAPGADTNFGWSADAGGDVDGDGHDDVAIGAFGDDTNGQWSGFMTVFSGATGDEIFRVAGEAGHAMGLGVAMARDVNGDGYGDVLASAGFESPEGETQRFGVVHVLGHDHVAGTPICFGQPNSTGTAASTVATSPSGFSAAANDLTLDVAGLPVSSLGYVIVSQSSDIVVRAGGSNGTLCISGPSLGRYAADVLDSGATGSVTFTPNLIAIPIATASGSGTVAVAPGDTFNFQYWYRDIHGQGSTSNFSSAVCVLFVN